MNPKRDDLRASAEYSPTETLSISVGSHNGCYFPGPNRIQTRSPKWQVLAELPAPVRAEIEARFWGHVDRSGTCWRWRKSSASGYGQMGVRLAGQFYNFSAHGLAWFFTHGLIPDGQCVCHNCPTGDDPRCVRPAHLFLGTQPQNLADARLKGRLDERRARVFKLTPAQRLEIFNAPRFRGSEVALALRFGVTKARIHAIREGVFAGSPTAHEQSPNQTFQSVLQSVPFVRLPVVGEVR